MGTYLVMSLHEKTFKVKSISLKKKKKKKKKLFLEKRVVVDVFCKVGLCF